MTYKANTMNITLSCMPIAFAGLTNTSKEYSIHTVVPRETGLKRNEGKKAVALLCVLKVHIKTFSKSPLLTTHHLTYSHCGN